MPNAYHSGSEEIVTILSQLEFIYSENELEKPYIMEKLPSHQINNKTNLCWDLNSAIP